MSPIDASDVTYEAVTVKLQLLKAALDELYSPSIYNRCINDLTNTVTATDNFNLKDESGQIVKIEGPSEPTNIIVMVILVMELMDGLPIME